VRFEKLFLFSLSLSLSLTDPFFLKFRIYFACALLFELGVAMMGCSKLNRDLKHK